MLYCSSLKLSGVKNWIFDDALKWVLFMLITLGSFHQIFGQDQLGLRMGNYAGSWSAAINPANSAYFSGKWDIGLGAFGFYENNDILYFKNTSALHSFLNADKIKTFSSDKELSDHQNGSITGIYDLNQASNFGQMMARLDGPSFLYKLNRNYTIGLSTSTRVNIGFQNIPQDLSSPRFDNVSSFENKILPPLKGNAMVWSEIAPILSHRRIADYDFSIGITPKLLIGHESVYLKSEDLAIKLGMDSSLYYAGNLNFGITHANLTSQEVGLKVSGWGTG
ncbi:MAG TPA: DUF5723 family protein [Saprospiraceae bacterium]|nr:DUF5723 family protein [Saprospiraceae bacterium]